MLSCAKERADGVKRVSVVAIPRFEPENPSRTESGEERLALHKNHEGGLKQLAQCVVVERPLTAKNGRPHGFRPMLALRCDEVEPDAALAAATTMRAISAPIRRRRSSTVSARAPAGSALPSWHDRFWPVL
jgi:hypothetical protein